MVTERNLLLLAVILAVAGVTIAQLELAGHGVPGENSEGVPGENSEVLHDVGFLDGRRDKRTTLLGYGLGLGKGIILGKAAGLALGKHYGGYNGNYGGGYPQGGYYPSGGYNGYYYPQYKGGYGGYNPYNNYYDYDYPGGGYYGGGYGGVGANSQASSTSFSGGLGPFHAGFSTSDASAGSYGYGR